MKSIRIILLSSLAMAFLSSCGSDICKCLKEAEKEKPNQEILNTCRDQFSQMEQTEIDAKIEQCRSAQ